MLNPAPLIHPILSIGDVRGGDLHGERAVQERGARGLQQKPRLSQSFSGGMEYFLVGCNTFRRDGILFFNSASLLHVR